MTPEKTGDSSKKKPEELRLPGLEDAEEPEQLELLAPVKPEWEIDDETRTRGLRGVKAARLAVDEVVTEPKD